MRKTKIICTLGPATDRENVLKELIIAGMDVARFNFSHSDHEEHLKRLNKLISLREELDLPIAALLDTRGPEIRIGKFKDKKISLTKGQNFTLTLNSVEGNSSCVSVNCESLIQDIKPGARVLIDDGLVEMIVISKTNTDIICTVNNDGIISDMKGVNVPGTVLSMPFISEKDRNDIIFGIEHGFDFIAASFTRSAEDILEIRKLLKEHNCTTIKIIAKIENLEGVENIDDIIAVSDGIMIARGDMGVEIPNEDVPVIQKMIIKKVYNAGKQVITATQMLDSMMKNPRPTRAETTDVANAIYDGTSAIMLSGETAAGLYPVEALKTMDCIAVRTEKDIDYKKRFRMLESKKNPDITDAISHATCTTAHDLNAAMIITVTKSGRTARMISRYRPECVIMGCTTEKHVCRQLNMSWGVKPILLEEEQDTFDLFEHAVETIKQKNYLKDGDLTVITAGVPLGISGTTNIIKVHIAGSHY
jgi:pyruvate kinase